MLHSPPYPVMSSGVAESLVLLLSSPADRELEIIEQLMNIQSDEGNLEDRLSLSQVLIQGFEVILPGKATMKHTIIPSTKGKSRKDVERAQNFWRIAIQVNDSDWTGTTFSIHARKTPRSVAERGLKT
nr:probable amino-acid racemase [Tanacetum cinerariifolium]